MAQDVAKDSAQGSVQDASGAADDGRVKVLILHHFNLPAAGPTPNARVSPPTLPWATREG